MLELQMMRRGGREIMNSIAEDVFLRSFQGSAVSCYDAGKERRPYHRQCSCALHKREQGSACFHGSQVKMAVNKACYYCSLSVEYSSLFVFQRNKLEDNNLNLDLDLNLNLNVLRIGRIDQWMSI